MKRTSSAILIAALSGTLAGPPAFSQSAKTLQSSAHQPNALLANSSQGDPFELDSVHSIDWRADLGLVLVAGSENGDAPRMLADVQFGLDFESFTESGRRWGLVLTVHGERDRGRVPHGGRVGDCPAGSGDCATVGGPGSALTPIASDSGLFSQGGAAGDRSRAMIDDAYAFTDIGWGELRLGYGAGAARLDPVGGPASGRLIRADGGHLLAAGPTAIRTETRHSGQDPKIVFRSIALGQETSVGTVRAAISFTPEARQCGVDYCPRRTGPGGQVGAINTDIAELALTYEVRRGDHEWAISASTSRAGGVEGVAGFVPISGSDFGISWRWNDWRAGGRWRRSNNAAAGNGDNEAWSASIGWEQGDWLSTVEYAASSDDFIHADGEIWQVSTSRLLGQNGLAAVGLQTSKSLEPEMSAFGRLQRETRDTTVFVELGWRY